MRINKLIIISLSLVCTNLYSNELSKFDDIDESAKKRLAYLVNGYKNLDHPPYYDKYNPDKEFEFEFGYGCSKKLPFGRFNDFGFNYIVDKSSRLSVLEILSLEGTDIKVFRFPDFNENCPKELIENQVYYLTEDITSSKGSSDHVIIFNDQGKMINETGKYLESENGNKFIEFNVNEEKGFYALSLNNASFYFSSNVQNELYSSIKNEYGVTGFSNWFIKMDAFDLYLNRLGGADYLDGEYFKFLEEYSRKIVSEENFSLNKGEFYNESVKAALIYGFSIYNYKKITKEKIPNNYLTENKVFKTIFNKLNEKGE